MQKLSSQKDYFNRLPLYKKILIMLIFVYILFIVLFGWYVSTEPSNFNVQEVANKYAQTKNENVVVGYTSVRTVYELMNILLHKRGGYLSNDITPPGVLIDNIPNWEFGALTQIRDFARTLRKGFSRSQSQSTEDVDLSKAEPLFNFDNKSWIMPETETEYQKGLDHIDSYLARLSDKKATFTTTALNLSDWFSDVSARLGSLSQRLSASVGEKIDRKTLKNMNVDEIENVIQTPWLQIDDIFYEARGQAYVLMHLLKAVEIDFAETLEKKGATVGIRTAIRELEQAGDTLWSPMILNGTGYGMLANHSLVMANYISRANAVIIDLRNLLNQG